MPRRPSTSKKATPLVRVPPHNYEAEESVLGGLLIDADALIKVADLIEPDDFYRDRNSLVYTAMVDLYQKSEPIDVLSVINRLKEKQQLETIGGEAAVAHLATVVPTAGNVVHYARIVRKTATLRRLISAASTISELGFDEAEEVDVVLDRAEQALFAVSQNSSQYSFTKLADALEDAFERIDKLHKGADELRGVSTGFHSLDNKLAGWQKSDLIILAARPSVGKTSLALDFARYAASNGTAVGFFSLEMSKDQLVDRLLAAHAHVDLWRLRTGKLDTSSGEFDDFSRIGHAMGELSNFPLFIDDHASNNVMGIRTMARRLQADQGLGLIIIDYLQLMESSRYSDNRVQEVSDISRSLKRLAIELNVPIIALSQLSRAVELRTDQKPKLSDLRESGCLAGDTLITRADTGERTSIQQLAERQKQVPVPIFALDENYRIVVRPMTKVFYSGKKQVFSLRTRCGQTIRASGNHPFRTLTGWQPLENLAVGDHIAVPRELTPHAPLNGIGDDELILLAHLLGDGCTVPRQPIHYTSGDLTNISTVERVAQKLFAIQPRRVQQKNWWHVYLPSPYRLTHGKRNPITQWLLDLGVGLYHAWEKKIPAAVFACEASKVRLFLHHLWATDGNISWKRLPGRLPGAAIYYSSTSKSLAEGVQHLLLQLGILSTLREVRSPLYRPGYQIHIQGRDMQLRFLTLVGSAGKRGLIVPELVQALTAITANTNIDIIPKSIWRGLVEQEKLQRGMSWRDVSRGIATAYSGSTLFKAGVGRERMAQLATALQSTKLQELAESHVHWDQILSITPQGVEDVYDATVPEVHNFVANDIFVHNSIEQDADVVLFIHRPPFEEERPDSFDVSLLIEKHRNGPTGEVTLHFESKFASYSEVDDHYEALPQLVGAPSAAN